MIIGRKSDADAVQYLFLAIVNQVESLSAKAWEIEKRATQMHGKAWCNSFKLGASSVVCSRIQEQNKKNQEEMKANSAISQALMIINNRKNEVDKIEKLMNMKYSNTSYRVSSGVAYVAGQKAGHGVNIGSNKGAIGSGNKMLKD